MNRFVISRKTILPVAAGLTALLLGVALPVTAHVARAATTDAAGQTQDARAFIDKLASQAVAFLADKSLSDQQKRDRFRTLLVTDYDMPTIGRFALGPAWNQMTPSQRQQYQSAFQGMIVRVYSARFQSYNGQTFRTTGAQPDAQTPGDTVVSSLIIPADGQGPQVRVDWRVRQKGGQYKVVDIVVEGVSMALTQRSDFSSSIQQNGGNIDAFLAQLQNQATGAAPAHAAQ